MAERGHPRSSGHTPLWSTLPCDELKRHPARKLPLREATVPEGEQEGHCAHTSGCLQLGTKHMASSRRDAPEVLPPLPIKLLMTAISRPSQVILLYSSISGHHQQEHSRCRGQSSYPHGRMVVWQFGLGADIILRPLLDGLPKEADFFDSTGFFQYNVRIGVAGFFFYYYYLYCSGHLGSAFDSPGVH